MIECRHTHQWLIACPCNTVSSSWSRQEKPFQTWCVVSGQYGNIHNKFVSRSFQEDLICTSEESFGSLGHDTSKPLFKGFVWTLKTVVWMRWRWDVWDNLTECIVMKGCIKFCNSSVKDILIWVPFVYLHCVFIFQTPFSIPQLLSVSFLDSFGYFWTFCFFCLPFLASCWGTWQP